MNTPPINSFSAPKTSGHLPPPKTPKKSIISKIFRVLLFWKKTDRFLEKNAGLIRASNQLLNRAKVIHTPQTQSSKGHFSATPITENSGSEIDFFEIRDRGFSPALSNLQLSAYGLMEKVFECLNEKYGTEAIDLNKFSTVFSYLKVLAKVLVQTTNQASPLLQAMEEGKMPTLKSALNRDDVSNSLRKAFSWLIDSTYQQEDIHNTLKQRLARIPIPAGQDLETHYLTPILDWAFQSDRTQVPHALRADFQHTTFNLVFEELGTLLLEKKIDSLDHILKTALGPSSLSAVVEKFLRENFLIFGQIVSDRVADLVHHSDYPLAFDQGLEIINNHLRAQIESTTTEEFAKNPHCHRTIKSQEVDKNPNAEQAFVASMVDKVYDLVFPQTEEENPFAIFWKEKQIPQEFQTLIDELKNLLNQILSPTVYENLMLNKGNLESLLGRIVRQFIEAHIKKQMKIQIHQFLKKLSNTDQFEALMVQHVFPLVNGQLLQTAFFQKLDNPECLEIISEDIQQFDFRTSLEPLQKRMAAYFLQWSDSEFNFPELSEEMKETGAMLAAEQILQFLQETEEADHALPIPERLNKFYSPDYGRVNKKIYGDIAGNILFEIGKLDEKMLKKKLGTIGTYNLFQYGAKKLIPIVQNNLTHTLSQSLAPYSESPDAVCQIAAKAIDKKFKTTQDVANTFFSKSAVSDGNPTTLQDQIELSSRLVYACVNGYISINAAKLPLEIVRESIQEIYKKCVTDPAQVKSLAFTVAELAVHTFQNAAKRIDHTA